MTGCALAAGEAKDATAKVLALKGGLVALPLMCVLPVLMLLLLRGADWRASVKLGERAALAANTALLVLGVGLVGVCTAQNVANFVGR